MKKYEYDYPENRKLGQQLRVGDQTFIAELTGYTIGYVDQIFDGKRTNDRVLDAARKLISNRDQFKEEFSKND